MMHCKLKEDMDLHNPHIKIKIRTDRKAHLIKESELFTNYAGFSQDESFIVILDSIDHLISEWGFTKIWKVDNNFNIEKCEIEIEYSGVIQFLPKADDKAGNETSDEANSKQFQHNTLMLDYPYRIVDALIYNYSEYIHKYLTVPQSDTIRRYFLRCLNGPYLLVDTSGRDPNKNIELYDLRTNQLLNVFKRYKFVLSFLNCEKPGAFVVSSDEKILAYVNGPDIKIYPIENGLELSSLSCKDGGMHCVDFMKSIFNNEKLLIFKDDKTVAVWDIFNSVREFIEFIPLENDTTAGLRTFEKIRSRSKLVELNLSEHIITDSIRIRAMGCSSSRKKYLIDMLNSDFNFQEKQIRLLIGYNTIQVWHGKRLEFISVVNDDPETSEVPSEKFKVIKLRYVKNAIKTLVYLDSQSKSANLAISGKHITFNEIVRQTKNIITRFITLYSNPWRLIDFCNKIMLEFIKLQDYSLITRLLFNEENASRDNSEKFPLKDMLPDEEDNTDVTMLTLFLEYYSNNAMDNIGWLNIVSEVIPELYYRNFGWYIQEFYYKPCFGRRRLDLSSMMFHKIEKFSDNSLEVYIAITQLIPHNKDKDFKLEHISDDEIPYIRMVPLINFVKNKESSHPKDKFKEIIEGLFLPGKRSSIKVMYSKMQKQQVNTIRSYFRKIMHFQDGSSLASKINDFDLKFKDKLNIRYICFLDEQEITQSWNDKSDEIGARWINAYGLHFKHEMSNKDDI
ncbi:26285_t:CDS:10 [Gigaspora margarita]|uniref:26285_t:CDS:1 n=1 Tax=Gigaspora margarita TaxID=4874 RepID=A0ABM8W4D1_GIGMA|nr:26285_t:CDS:10 [Gigaspora margarita]